MNNAGSEGIIEDVYLLGAPVSGNPSEWKTFQKVVAGTMVNAYSKSDWLLKFLFRFSSVSMTIAGLSPVQWSNRRMCNIDVTHIVSGHGDYFHKMTEILETIGVKTHKLPTSNSTPPPPPPPSPPSQLSSPDKLLSPGVDGSSGASSQSTIPHDTSALPPIDEASSSLANSDTPHPPSPKSLDDCNVLVLSRINAPIRLTQFIDLTEQAAKSSLQFKGVTLTNESMECRPPLQISNLDSHGDRL